jgi:porin
LQLASATPLIGGGGETTFWNLGLAAPISGVTPPYILGGLLSIKTNPVDYSILVYDPRNAKDSDILSDPFSDGVTLSVSATVPYSFNAFPGYQGLRVVYSSQDGFDLENLPQLQLPPESRDVLNRKDSFYYIAYSFQQYLASFGDGKGWGVFGQLALSDGNPNPVNSSVFLGLGGNSFISGRQDDRWGAAFVLYNFSDDLKDGLDALGSGIRDEYGVEAFYDFQISGNFSIGGDLQVIRPGTPSTDTAIVAGIRARMSF